MDRIDAGDFGAINGWDERITSLPQFGDDTLAPLEYLEISRRKSYDQPERKLMLALLTDALFCFQHYFGAAKRSRRKLNAAADQWIFHTGSAGLYDFESVCEHLNIDPQYLRRGLRRWKKHRGAALALSAPCANGAARPGRGAAAEERIVQ